MGVLSVFDSTYQSERPTSGQSFHNRSNLTVQLDIVLRDMMYPAGIFLLWLLAEAVGDASQAASAYLGRCWRWKK